MTILQKVNADVVSPYQIDENGVPIKPGYRKPFTTESAKRYSLKALSIRTERRQARLLAAKPQIASSAVEIAAKLATLRRMQRRALAQAIAENDAKKQSLFMRSFTAAFDAEQSLLGNSTIKRKSVSPINPQPIDSSLMVGPTKVVPAGDSDSERGCCKPVSSTKCLFGNKTS